MAMAYAMSTASFLQKMNDGYQVEISDNWLLTRTHGKSPGRSIFTRVKFYGRVHQFTDAQGRLCHEWVDTHDVMAMAYDTPIPGYRNSTVNNSSPVGRQIDP